jgi:hypothetical protein
MNKPLVIALVGLLLIGAGYVFYIYAPKGQPGATTVPAATSTQSAGVTEKSIAADTDTYHLEMKYPQFGIASVDAVITGRVDSAVTAFKSYPANPSDSAVPKNDFTGWYSSVYRGSDVISVALSFSEYTGGAHPNTNVFGVNVDLRTGKELTLDDALTLIGKNLQQVAAESLVQVKAVVGDSVFEEGAAARPENYTEFLINKDNVTFIFNAYQVAPYAAGTQQAVFPRVQ